MKKLIALVFAVMTVLAVSPSAEARDRRWSRGHSGHRSHGYFAPRYCAPRPVCPPRIYYAPRYCAPRPYCPPVYGFGYVRPSVHLSFGYVGRPSYRW
jgi:hypothetical protein